jgi:hypothetical protein
MKRSTFRRIVTGDVNGKSVVESDEQIEAYEFHSVPGYEHTLIWVNATTPDLRRKQQFDPHPESVVPGPGGTSLHFVTFPPGSVFAEPSFDADAARSEALVRLRGLADHFERDDPAMHRTTPSIIRSFGMARPSDSKGAMSSCKTGPGTRGATKEQSRRRCCFS